MKLKVIKFLLILTGVAGFTKFCPAQKINSFYFEEAQPRKIEKLSRFPQSIRGLYKNDKDTSRRIQITDDSLYFEIPMIQVASVNDLKSKNYQITDSLITDTNNKTYRCIVREDTVYFADFVKSVLFVSDEFNCIKKIGDYLVLSKKNANGLWDCMLLYKENQKICLAYFDFGKKHEELNKNKRVEKTKSGNEDIYLGNFKEKDFVKLINTGYFPDKLYFEKRWK